MNIQRGMTGDTVSKIETRLKELQLYNGSIDGSFGGGTEAGIKNLQIREHLPPTGIVDPVTWGRLFPGVPPPEPALASAPVGQRCLALTGTFETGAQPPDCFCGVTGDFDGMGISFGVLQWNLGQNSLQPLLSEMIENHEDVCRPIFHENLDTIKTLGAESLEDQLKFARSIQTPKGQLMEPWLGMLKALGRTPEFRAIQADHASDILNQAIGLCSEFRLKSQRGIALMFDIVTQNGSVKPIVKTQIMADFAQLPASGAAELEVARMRIIANRVAASARPQFIDDVRVRKLTIAEGKGVVHGIPYDLEGVFCLTLDPFAIANSAAE